MSMELWQKEDYPKIKMGVVRDACEDEQKKRIRARIEYFGIEEGKRTILSYFDRAQFCAVKVKQTQYKNLNSYLHKEAERGALIKCSSGRGSYLSFVFPKKELERMIDEVIDELTAYYTSTSHGKGEIPTVTIHKTHSLGPSETLHVKEKSCLK